MDSQLLVHFVVIGTGFLLGRVKLAGISLGSSGVIFSALVVGYLGHSIPAGSGRWVSSCSRTE